MEEQVKQSTNTAVPEMTAEARKTEAEKKTGGKTLFSAW